MFKKIFTNKQLSLFFQIALIINIISAYCNLIVYHFFPDHKILKHIIDNFDHVGLFMICITIISQALFIFSERHQQFVTKYKILAISLEACICVFFIWLISIEDEIQSKTIIFSSSLSQYDHSYKLAFTLIAIFIMISLNFYKTLKNPMVINNESVPKMLGSIFRVVIRKHLIIFICFFGIIHFKTLHKFAQTLLHHSESSFLFDVSLLEFIIPIIWLLGIGYYIYQRQYPDTKA
ncbi:MAG: hypothetical protein Q8Q60_05355 [Candidatus Chromulinivorax sp.]|nr:hypothetical protein [Candidatus Chromulinivorax sp.]